MGHDENESSQEQSDDLMALAAEDDKEEEVEATESDQDFINDKVDRTGKPIEDDDYWGKCLMCGDQCDPNVQMCIECERNPPDWD